MKPHAIPRLPLYSVRHPLAPLIRKRDRLPGRSVPRRPTLVAQDKVGLLEDNCPRRLSVLVVCVQIPCAGNRDERPRNRRGETNDAVRSQSNPFPGPESRPVAGEPNTPKRRLNYLPFLSPVPPMNMGGGAKLRCSSMHHAASPDGWFGERGGPCTCGLPVVGRGSTRGIVRRTRVPFPGCEITSRRAPTCCARADACQTNTH